MIRHFLKFVLIINIFMCAEARGDAPTPEVLADEAQAAYDHDDFVTALARWQASYDLSQENELLFDIAQAYRRLGNCPRALATYKQYLTVDPAGEQHALAEDLAREEEIQCPVVVPLPKADPPKAVVVLHVDKHPNDPEDQGRSIRIAGITAGGAGLVVLASGLVLGHHGAAIGDEVTSACHVSCDWDTWRNADASGRRDATIGRVLDVVGVVGIAGGAALYYLGARAPNIVVTPASEGGAAVSWGGVW